MGSNPLSSIFTISILVVDKLVWASGRQLVCVVFAISGLQLVGVGFAVSVALDLSPALST